MTESAWGNESFAPWTGESIAEDATVFIALPGGGKRPYQGRVVRDDAWVHVQPAAERLSFPSCRVNCILWQTAP